jgi:hypothetical protein
MILADTNVLIDVVENDPNWADWSQRQLEAAAASDDLAINAVVYAELSVGYRSIHDLDAMLAAAGIVLMQIPRPALFLAGKAFRRYRRAGGTKTGVLPDFLIGAHAVVEDAALITRDAARYQRYFRGIALIAPN